MSPFRQHYDSFDPEILAVLEISFNETWTELQHNGDGLDQASRRTAVADLIMKFASQGESDPQKIKALVLAALSLARMDSELYPLVRGTHRPSRGLTPQPEGDK